MLDRLLLKQKTTHGVLFTWNPSLAQMGPQPGTDWTPARLLGRETPAGPTWDPYPAAKVVAMFVALRMMLSVIVNTCMDNPSYIDSYYCMAVTQCSLCCLPVGPMHHSCHLCHLSLVT